MTQGPLEITVPDPGEGRRLDAQERRALRAELKRARRSDAGAVLVVVEEHAWNQEPLADAPELTADRIGGELHGLVEDLFTLEVPVVVHLAGPVTGLGLGLALAADLRFATPDTSLAVGPPGSANALVSGVPWLLAQLAGSSLVADLVWTGRSLDADQSMRNRLLNGVGHDDREARAAADRLAELPRAASSALKRSLHGRLAGELRAQLDYDSWLATVSLRAVR